MASQHDEARHSIETKQWECWTHDELLVQIVLVSMSRQLRVVKCGDRKMLHSNASVVCCVVGYVACCLVRLWEVMKWLLVG